MFLDINYLHSLTYLFLNMSTSSVLYFLWYLNYNTIFLYVWKMKTENDCIQILKMLKMFFLLYTSGSIKGRFSFCECRLCFPQYGRRLIRRRKKLLCCRYFIFSCSAFSNNLVPVYNKPFKRIINYLYAMNLETTEVSLTTEEKKQLEEYDR